MANRTRGLAEHYRTALVTGASSGIGLAIAQRLLAADLKVHGTTRNPRREGLPGGIQWIRFEGSSREGIDAFLAEQEELLREVDILVNNAGSSLFGKTAAIPGEALAAQQTLLLDGPIQLTRHLLARDRRDRPACIVNVSSLAALFPLPYMGAYSACKAGLSTFTQSLMISEKGSGAVLIDFQPGDFLTAFNRNIRRYGVAGPREERAWRRYEAALGKAPPPEQAAEDVCAALLRGKSCTLRSGSFFQRSVAPLGQRLLPARWLRKAVALYYGMG